MLESRSLRPAAALLPALILFGCGRTPTGTGTPTPPPVTYSATVIVFSDDNNDGVQGSGEPGGVPDAEVEGAGTVSDVGAGRIQRALNKLHPAYVLIDWGVNDWNPQPGEYCQGDPGGPNCQLIENLTTVIDIVQSYRSLPVLSTLTPPNTSL